MKIRPILSSYVLVEIVMVKSNRLHYFSLLAILMMTWVKLILTVRLNPANFNVLERNSKVESTKANMKDIVLQNSKLQEQQQVLRNSYDQVMVQLKSK